MWVCAGGGFGIWVCADLSGCFCFCFLFLFLFCFFFFFLRWCWWMWVCAGGGCRLLLRQWLLVAIFATMVVVPLLLLTIMMIGSS